MVRVVAVMSLVVACYSDTDYSATRFKCDATHACPPGQTCVSGRCTVGGNGSGSDAAVAMGVACGTSTCLPPQVCCVDFIGGPDCVANAASCAGIAAACDGVEDCTGGNACCDLGSGDFSCGPSTCSTQICLDNTDCKSPAQPTCCFDFTPGEPWGRCLSSCP